MTTPHIHAELIKAWADGATIQYWDMLYGGWKNIEIGQPTWDSKNKYRITPSEPKKVKMWKVLYFYKPTGAYISSNIYYASEDSAKDAYKDEFIKLLPHTEIEIEVIE